MTKRLPLAALILALPMASAGAESLSCRSVNGNVTCSGSGAVACQTVNGQTTCTGGNGAVVQRFGRSVAPPVIVPDAEMDEDLPPRLFLDRRSAPGRMTIERDGTRLRLRSDRLSIDRD
jgi:hypothetical protein